MSALFETAESPAKRTKIAALKKKVHVVFLDVVDFDNWEGLFLLLKQYDHVLIAVTSRAVDAELAPAKLNFQTLKATVDRKGVVDLKDFFADVKAKADQPVNHADSSKLVRIHLEFMDKYLQAADFKNYKLFNGGYAPQPGLTSDLHKLCYLFHDGANFCPSAEYKRREAEWFEKTPAERRTAFDAIQATKEFPDVGGLVARLRESDVPIAAWFLGPMTAAAQIVARQDLLVRFVEAYVMGSCWDPTGKSNLLGKNFNYGVDEPAAVAVLEALTANENCRTLVAPTETTKNAVCCFSAEEYLGGGTRSTLLRQGRTFWNDVKGGKQPPFDVPPCVPSEEFVKIEAVCKVTHALKDAMAITEVPNSTVTSLEEWATAKGVYAILNPDTEEKCRAIKSILTNAFALVD